MQSLFQEFNFSVKPHLLQPYFRNSIGLHVLEESTLDLLLRKNSIIRLSQTESQGRSNVKIDWIKIVTRSVSVMVSVTDVLQKTD